MSAALGRVAAPREGGTYLAAPVLSDAALKFLRANLLPNMRRLDPANLMWTAGLA